MAGLLLNYKYSLLIHVTVDLNSPRRSRVLASFLSHRAGYALTYFSIWVAVVDFRRRPVHVREVVFGNQTCVRLPLRSCSPWCLHDPARPCTARQLRRVGRGLYRCGPLDRLNHDQFFHYSADLGSILGIGFP